MNRRRIRAGRGLVVVTALLVAPFVLPAAASADPISDQKAGSTISLVDTNSVGIVELLVTLTLSAKITDQLTIDIVPHNVLQSVAVCYIKIPIVIYSYFGWHKLFRLWIKIVLFRSING